MRWLRGFEGHHRSLAKAITWRITGSVDTFVISYILTGHWKVAGSIAATEVITKIALYYFHERLWALASWGRRDLKRGRLDAANSALLAHGRAQRGLS
jgi:uncharacterized membrane protein